MKAYTIDDVLCLAKRVNNTKRQYLLVNPLQAKHMPVSPSAALEMMQTLGKTLAAKYPQTRLIIGFAETATAIGAAVASCFPPECFYMHTTRENPESSKDWITFQEEHSHATEQKLSREGFLTSLDDNSTILLIEDELSTGRTLQNIICQLREMLPPHRRIQMVAACVINRMSADNESRLLQAGISCECLVRIPNEDFSKQLKRYSVCVANRCSSMLKTPPLSIFLHSNTYYPNPRMAVRMDKYAAALQSILHDTVRQVHSSVTQRMHLLVLGTEECMYPALLLGSQLEQRYQIQVFCHSTTRSPIGICSDLSYPIHDGCRLTSLYQNTRETYIYNLSCYDVAIIVTDAHTNVKQGLIELEEALRRHGTSKIFFLEL